MVDERPLEAAVARQGLEDHLADNVTLTAPAHLVEGGPYRLLEELLGDTVVDAGDVVGQHALLSRQVVLQHPIHCPREVARWDGLGGCGRLPTCGCGGVDAGGGGSDGDGGLALGHLAGCCAKYSRVDYLVLIW